MTTNTDTLSYSEPSLRDRITRTAVVYGVGYKNHITTEVPLGAIVLDSNIADTGWGSVTTLCGKTTDNAVLDFDDDTTGDDICKTCARKNNN
jgi:hypothetical protein